MSTELAKNVIERLDTLARISDEPGRITRTFGSPATKRANAKVAGWMREAGLETREDAVGNLIGHYPGESAGAKSLLLGSHLDTVRDAGKFDGTLGVLAAITCVQALHEARRRLPFALQVVAFAGEEGIRFPMPYVGSRALVGALRNADLQLKDVEGVTLAEAIRRLGGDPDQLLVAKVNAERFFGYAEVHIEQGPVLEQNGLPLGIVTGIAGQTRARLIYTGRAGHAGTTPLSSRSDALCAAAEFVLQAEARARGVPGLVATVGQIQVEPGASNVIPGWASLTLDVRHAKDEVRDQAVSELESWARLRAEQRAIKLGWETVQSVPAVACDRRLSDLLAECVARRQMKVLRLPSGAGHDAAVLSTLMPVAMLFVRCKNGLSHHPDESASLEDIAAALEVLNDFIASLAEG